MEDTKKILVNDKVRISYDTEDKSISGRDLVDMNNMPAFFSKSKRNIENAWKVLEERFNDSTTMSKAMDILFSEKITCHSYCQVD